MQYIRFSENYSKNILIPDIESPFKYIKNLDKPYFISMMKYSDKQFVEWSKTKSLAKMSGSTTDKLWADFDSADVKTAFEDAKVFYSRLKDSGLEDNNIQISFSGNKGVGFIVSLKEQITLEEVKSIVFELSKGLETFDTSMYDHQRIFRLLFTKHEKSGLYKIPITPDELIEANLDSIVENARNIDAFNKEDVLSYYEPCNLTSRLIELKQIKQVEEKHKSEPQKDHSLDEAMSSMPRHWKKYKWALVQGFFESGERHNALMVVAATCRGLGYDKNTSYYMCKSALKKQAERSGSEEFSKEELWENIIEYVYSENWDGGQYSPKTNPWLAKYCERMGFKEDLKEDEAPKRILDVKDAFEHYVRHIEENTIKTGIATLDREVPLTIGMNLGIVGAASSGKCLGKDTPVRMYDGTVKMVQDVKVGDLLMGDDSTPRTVLSTCTGREKLYKVIQENGNAYVVNASHILSLKTNENKGFYQKGQIIDINIEDFIGRSNDFKSRFYGFKVGVEYQEQKLPVDPYYLGLWLGDGSSYGTYLYTKDPEVEEYNKKLAGQLELNHRVYVDPRTGVKTVKIIGNKQKDNHLRQKMIELGVLKNSKHRNNSKHIPSVYLINSRENRLKLLAGLMDSDGHAKNDKSNYTIVQSNKVLAENIVELVRSLGFKASINEVTKYATNTDDKNKGTYYSVYFSGNDYSELTKHMLIERKKCKEGTSRADDCTRISFEDLGEGDYYGFEIDGNHRFLLGDFTVTHNTALALEILKNTSKSGVISVFASLDMHRNRLFEKLLYKTTGLSRDELYQKIKDEGIDSVTQKIKEDYANVYFYDRSCPTVEDVRRFCEKVQEETGQPVKLVMVDYFERINSERSEETAASKDIAGQLQDLVNDLNVCLITLVQPNKFSLSGGPDAPIKSYTAIKGSSFLYQSFRSIISIWRPFFTPEDKDKDKYMQMGVLKNDLGELGIYNFSWNGKRGEIHELTEEQEYEMNELLRQKEARKSEKAGDGGWD